MMQFTTVTDKYELDFASRMPLPLFNNRDKFLGLKTRVPIIRILAQKYV